MTENNIIENNIKTNTVIVGGGIIGASLALKLAQNRQSVTLIDARTSLTQEQWQQKLTKRDSRVFALNLATINLLKEIGVWQNIENMQRKVDYTNMLVWQKNGAGELKFNGEEVNASQKEILGSMIEPIVIEYAISQKINQMLSDKELSSYLKHITGQKVASIDWLGESLSKKDGYKVTLVNNEKYIGKLLVGADGRNSFIRVQSGIHLDTLDYQQTAISCAIRTEKPHLSTARQVMLPTGTLALLPLADLDMEDIHTDLDSMDTSHLGHWQSIVWTLPTNQAIDVLSKNNQAIAEEIAYASGYELGKTLEIQSIASFPLSAQQARSYIKPNLALIGDSAHGVHPLAGQGLNLGMLDVIELSKRLLHDYKRSGKSGTQQWGHWHSLQRYERSRRANNSIMMHSFSLINWFFAGELATLSPIQQMRSEGMAFVGRNKPLMNWFSKQASGL